MWIRQLLLMTGPDMIIIFDDGLATGVSTRAAIESAKILQKPKKIIFACPVGDRDGANSVRDPVETLVCVSEVDNFMAIGCWYHDSPQITDKKVIEFLKKQNVNMSKSKTQNPINKKKLLREVDHLTTPPRLEGNVKNAKMNPIKKTPKPKT